MSSVIYWPEQELKRLGFRQHGIDRAYQRVQDKLIHSSVRPGNMQSYLQSTGELAILTQVSNKAQQQQAAASGSSSNNTQTNYTEQEAAETETKPPTTEQEAAETETKPPNNSTYVPPSTTKPPLF